MAKPKFEKSKFDNDRGVREGSKKDLERDAKEKREMERQKAKKSKAKSRG